jgi:hypothetical protein
VYEVLRSPGQPLDAATRAFFEPRFRYDFSQVRVHTDEKAAASARAVASLAYTAAPHIAFAAGRFAPSSYGGRHLIAHELAHIAQQSQGSSVRLQRWTYEDSCEGCGQLLMYRYFRNSILIDLLPELFPPGFRERERTQA